MKRLDRYLVFFLLACTVIYLTSCKVSYSYGIFHFDQIDQYSEAQYLSEENLDYLRIMEEVAIIPRIKAINHGAYGMGISVYSSRDDLAVTIEHVTIDGENQQHVELTVPVAIYVSKSGEGYYYGSEEIGDISMDDINATQGSTFTVTVEVNVNKLDGTIVNKTISYHVKVTQTVGLVMR